MKVEITTSNNHAVIEIITVRGRFKIRDSNINVWGMEDIQKCAAELAYILDCKYIEKEKD